MIFYELLSLRLKSFAEYTVMYCVVGLFSTWNSLIYNWLDGQDLVPSAVSSLTQ